MGNNRGWRLGEEWGDVVQFYEMDRVVGMDSDDDLIPFNITKLYA